MRIRRVYLAALVLMLGACSGESSPEYPLLSGGSLALNELRGRVVLINYWAEWCAPCREEIPELNAFAVAELERVTVLSVNFDGVSGERLSGQVADLGIEFETLTVDPRGDLQVPPSTALPETVVIGPDGEVVTVLQGAQTAEGLEEIVNTLLEPA